MANAIRRSRSGLSDPNRPTGSFLFLGPTGVGKTELCKALAGFLFDSEDHMIRVDMSEFMEKHSVGRLIGAPPGYVGYDEGGYLTEAVRRKPYSVLLLDEVEKAHPDVFNVLLQVLDDGRLTDGQGRTVDFKNTVIVMTSNLGSHLIMQMAGQTSELIREAVWVEVKQHFRPEFLNRIDETVVFHALDAKHIEAIAKIQLKVLEARLEKMDMKLEVSPQALAELAKVGFDPVFGARPLKRAIQQRIENPVAKLILEGRFGPKDVIPVDVRRRRVPLRARRALTERDAAAARGARAGRPRRRRLVEQRVQALHLQPRQRQVGVRLVEHRVQRQAGMRRHGAQQQVVRAERDGRVRASRGPGRARGWCRRCERAARCRAWRPSSSAPGRAPACAIGRPLASSKTQQLDHAGELAELVHVALEQRRRLGVVRSGRARRGMVGTAGIGRMASGAARRASPAAGAAPRPRRAAGVPPRRRGRRRAARRRRSARAGGSRCR